jgi:hypothetical protein
VVRHEATQKMKVWLLGIGLQQRTPKYLKLLQSKAIVVSAEESVPLDRID